MNGFRSGEIQILVATDIAARGIDVCNVSHVINFDIPATPEAYIHRIGRTGRAESCGEAFTLVTEADTQMVNAIHRAIGSRVEQRTLADFNYDVPSGPRGPTVKPFAKRPQVRAKRRRSTSKANGRSSKGAFAWLSPDKARRAGGQCQP
jgi:superfamily II DNA/RNA helicase